MIGWGLKGLAEGFELVKDLVGREDLFGVRRVLSGRSRTPGTGREPDAADLKIFLKAIELQKVGELEGSDVAASGADLGLEIRQNALEIGWVKAGLEEVEPEPLAIKTQAKGLAGGLTIKLMELLDGGPPAGGILSRIHAVAGKRFTSQGSRSMAAWTCRERTSLELSKAAFSRER